MLASGSGYRSWHNTAVHSYSRGKASYEEIIKSVHDRESECEILHSRERSVISKGYSGEGQETDDVAFSCLNQLQNIDNQGPFDINKNVEDLSGGTRKERVLAEGGCWQYVLREVNGLDVDKCDIKGELSRSLIALAKTKCHFIRSGRSFPLSHQGCYLNPAGMDDDALHMFSGSHRDNPCSVGYTTADCEKLKADIVAKCTNPLIMSESAFQMYHADLNHIDDICFYLQSGEWNRRTESNINRLGDAASRLLHSQEDMETFLDQVQQRQEESIKKANMMTAWMDSLSDDIHDVFHTLEVVKRYQHKIIAFFHNFKLFFIYALYILIGMSSTLFEATALARPKIVLTIATAGIMDSLVYKACVTWLPLKQYGMECSSVYRVMSLLIGWTAALYSTLTWLRALLSYQPPAQAMLKEMYQIRKILTPRVVYPGFHADIEDNEGSETEYNANGYSLDDFVELFGDHSDSTYTYDSGYTTTDSWSGSLGEESEDLVEEYLDTQTRRRKTRATRRISNRR